MEAKQFVIWAAVSSQPQVEKVSLSDQIALGHQHADRWAGDVVAELIVPGESRDIVLLEDACREIEAYAQLRELIAQRQFDVLCYLNRARLGRDAALSMAIASLCARAGIVLYDMESPPASLDAPRRQSHADLLIGAIKSVGAQQEINELTRRHESGMTGRILRGDFSGQQRWGWRIRYEPGPTPDSKPRKIYELDPVAQSAINLIVTEYLHRGTGTASIAEKLQAAGYPPPKGEAWHKNTIRMIIAKSLIYAGYTELNRDSKTGRKYVRAKSKWPALISEQDAEALLAEQHRRASARRSVGSHGRFSQVVWCGQCNRRKIYTHLVLKQKYEHEGYECRPRHPAGHITARRITSAVQDALLLIADEAQRQQIVIERPNRAAELRPQIEALEKQIRQIEAKRERAQDFLTDGTLDKTAYQRQMARMDEQAAALADQIDELQEAMRAEERAGQFEERLTEAGQIGLAMLTDPDVPYANAWLRNHLRVWIREDSIEVEFL